MKDTAFWLGPDKADRLATVHWMKDGKLTPLDDAHGHPDSDLFLLQPWSVNSYTVNHKRKGGSYGLVATAEDYWRFAQMILNGGEFNGARILSPHTVHLMGQDHLEPAGIPDYEREVVSVSDSPSPKTRQPPEASAVLAAYPGAAQPPPASGSIPRRTLWSLP